MKKNILLGLTCLLLLSCHKKSDEQIEQILSQMTTREKVAQLMMISVDSESPEANQLFREQLIREEGIGGVILTNDRLTGASALVSHLDSVASIPLLVAVDGEWGPAMRFAELPFFPKQLQLGALLDEHLVYEMGKMVGEQCQLIGIHINFAPVVDINNNPLNPAINTRSFGSEAANVATKGSAYMRGMQATGISASAKHFPGHGDTNIDSHKSLPVLNLTRERLDTVELVPFKRLINDGVDFVMLGHLLIPALDSVPTTHSQRIIHGLLEQELGFHGIVISDALTMRGLVKDTLYAEAVREAYHAGVEMLLMPYYRQISKALTMLVDDIENGVSSEEELNQRVRKILRLKQRYGLLDKDFQHKTITADNIQDFVLDHKRVDSLNQEIANHSVCAIRADEKGNAQSFRQQALMPLADSIAYIGYRAEYKTLHRHYGEGEGLSGYADYSGIDTNNIPLTFKELQDRGYNITIYHTPAETTNDDLLTAITKAKDYKHVIVGIHDPYKHRHSMLDIPKEHIDMLQDLAREANVSIAYFGNPYDLQYWTDLRPFHNFLLCFADNCYNERAAALLLAGDIIPDGTLPVTLP